MIAIKIRLMTVQICQTLRWPTTSMANISVIHIPDECLDLCLVILHFKHTLMLGFNFINFYFI